MRAQNFNYLRKISIDPWREIERPAMKRGYREGRYKRQKPGRAVKAFIGRYQFLLKETRRSLYPYIEADSRFARLRNANS